MAMTKCKECKAEVSTKAKLCPQCGVKNPGITAKESMLGLLIVAAIGWGVVSLSSSDEASTEVPAMTDAQCQADLQCWGNKHTAAVGIVCDDHVEKLAQFSFEWTDGALEPKFSHFRWKDQAKGLLTYVGDSLKLQNGFGAWGNYVYECDFDPVNRQVMAVRAEPGQI